MRPILPKQTGLEPPIFPTDQNESQPLPRRQAVVAACDSCRKSKIKCSGHRPVCRSCASRKRECVYRTNPAETPGQAVARKFTSLASQRSSHARLLELMASSSEDRAMEIFRRLRSGMDTDSILRQVEAGDLLLQLSCIPETGYQFDFPYLARIPALLRSPENEYLTSLVYNASVYGLDFDQGQSPGPPREVKINHSSSTSPYLKPYHAAQLVDSLLSEAKPSEWTTVSSDNNLLKHLLEMYFLQNHPFYPIVHKDLFLEDMTANRQQLCSPLLVNALLAMACRTRSKLTDRYKFWDRQSLGSRFLAEAERLLDQASKHEIDLQMIQAAVLIGHNYNTCGLDKIGTGYTIRAISMARRIKLFAAGEGFSWRMQTARVFTSWGLYCWDLMMSYYFLRSPLCRDPPETALPDPSTNPNWYPSLLLRYPLEQQPVSADFGSAFKAMCGLRVILNSIATDSFADTQSSRRGLSWPRTVYYRTRLANWIGSLPQVLSPENIMLPMHLMIHLEYHSTIITLFRSQLPNAELGNDSEGSSRDSQNSIAHQYITGSLVRFETLLRLYFLRHGFETYQSFLVHFLAVMGNTALQELRDSAVSKQPVIPKNGSAGETDANAVASRRSTLLLCLKGLQDQGKNIHAANLVLRIFYNQLDPDERSLAEVVICLRKETQHTIVRSSQVAEDIQAQWVIPLATTLHNDPDATNLEYVYRKFQASTLS